MLRILLHIKLWKNLVGTKLASGVDEEIDSHQKIWIQMIISGSLVDRGDELIPLFTLFIRLNTATDIRIERLKRKEYEHFALA